MEKNVIYAGAGKAEIKFIEADFPLKAFAGVHDAIYARVILMEGEIKFLLLSIELTSLTVGAVNHFRKLCSMVSGIDEENIFVSVTHTFSAPHIPPHVNNEQERRLTDTMYARIDKAVRDALKQAIDTKAPTQLEYAVTPCSLNVNRNISTPEGYWIGQNEEGYSDHLMRILKLKHEDGIFAYLINYDIQPSVMDKSRTISGESLISGDMAGEVCRSLEKGKITSIFLPGCAGDQSPIIQAASKNACGEDIDIHEKGYTIAEVFGIYMAGRVLLSKGEVQDLSLHMTSVTAMLPEQVMKYSTKELTPHKEYAFELTGNTIEVPISLLELGDVKLLMTPPELNSSFGTELRSILGEKLMIVTLVNGALKYLPQKRDFERITYTAMNTTLGYGSEEGFIQAVSELKEKRKL
jgi:hypothetical protein